MLPSKVLQLSLLKKVDNFFLSNVVQELQRLLPKLLTGKRMQATVLRHAARSPRGWKLRSVATTVATIQRCMSGTVGPSDCT